MIKNKSEFLNRKFVLILDGWSKFGFQVDPFGCMRTLDCVLFDI
jgi:hypothetical protein